MKSVKGTKTEVNLLTAFAGESQARNRYTYFASKAKEEGFVQIQLVFEETANQEKEHAKRLFKFLEGGMAKISAEFPAGIIGTTRENLAEAAGGENYEWKEMYPGLQKWRAKRDSMRLRRSSNPSRWPRSSMRSGMRHLWRTSMQAASLRETNLWCGDASTAATSSKVPSRPKSARHVRTHRDISNFWLRIGKGGMQ